jgi:uncharacterized membrane protein YraQ (UPF0718 family)
MRRDNPWVIAIVAAIVSGLIVGVIVSEIDELKEEELLKSQIDSSVQNVENLLNIGLNEEAIRILEDTLKLFSREQFPERYGQIKILLGNAFFYLALFDKKKRI